MASRYGDLTPYELFCEFTCIDDEESKREFERHCLATWHLAVIERETPDGFWLWHTLVDLKAQLKWEKPLADRFRQPNTRKSPERQLVATIARTLRAHGMHVETEVRCPTGVIDMVTALRDVIYEVKARLSHDALLKAVGQLMLYRQSINPEARLVIIGVATPDTPRLRPYIEALGIEIIEWRESARDEG